MLWEGSDDAVVCLHSGLSVPRSTECSRRKQQELLKSHSQTLHSAWACSAPLLGIDSHPKAMGFGSWSHQEVSFGAPQVLVAVSGQSLPKTQQRRVALLTHRHSSFAQAGEKLETPPGTPDFPLQRKMCPGSTSCSIPAVCPSDRDKGSTLHKAQLCTQSHSEQTPTELSELPDLDHSRNCWCVPYHTLTWSMQDSGLILQPTGSSGADMGSAVQLSRAGTRQIFVPKFSYQQELLLMPASCLARAVSCSYSLWCLSQANSCAWERAALVPCDVYFIPLLSPRQLKNSPGSS